jgi:outer membrane biosynthesis protein TonB
MKKMKKMKKKKKKMKKKKKKKKKKNKKKKKKKKTVLGTYERRAITSVQTGSRGTARIKADNSVLNRNVNRRVYTHEDGTGTCSACSSQLRFLYFMPTALPTH